MQKFLSWFLPVVVVCAIMFIFSPFQDTHWPKWFVFYICAAAGMGIYYGCRIHSSVGLLVASTIFSGSMAFANRLAYAQVHLVEQIDIANVASKATLCFLIMIWFAERLSLKVMWSLVNAYIAVCVAHCFYAMYQIATLKPPLTFPATNGFLPNISMGPSMLAMLLPIVIWKAMGTKEKNYRRMYWAVVALFILMNYLHQSSISYAAIVASVVTLVFCTMTIIFGKFRAFAGGVVLTALLIPIGAMFDNTWTNFTQINRFKYWPMFFNWWWENASHAFGTGTGTFRHIGPVIQTMNPKYEEGWWLWAHNDWLQIMFECGIIGVVAAFCVGLVAIGRAYRSMHFGLVAALVSTGVVMAGNYPLRLAEFSTLVMLLVGIAFKMDTENLKDGDFDF